MRIDNEIKLDFKDVLIRPKRSTLTSRKDVQLERTFKFLHSKKTWIGIPIITANMATTGTLEMAKALSKHKIITALHKFYTVDELDNFFKEFNNPDYIAYTLGIRDEDFEKLKEVQKRGLLDKFSFICLDVPNAYLEIFTEKLKNVREICPEHIIIAGNVVTNEITEQILLNGADIVKIGIGSGSACLTRKQTGVGYPQLSAVIECADAAHGISIENGAGRIVSDGGITSSSCIAKALGGGADFVMIGSMFAGYDQSGGEIIDRDGKKYKEHYGMSSATAMNKYYGKVDAHRASEGRTTEIPYRGDVENLIHEILGSLRSTATYIGARNLREFSKRTTFIMVKQELSNYLEEYDNHKN
jgi:GMP reductase